MDKIERDEVERRFQKIEVNSGKLLFYGKVNLFEKKWFRTFTRLQVGRF